MKPRVLITLALMLVALSATPIYAQSTVDSDVEAPVVAFVTVDLDAGNPLDPFIVSLNGGGETEASSLSDECVGFISADPSLTINWSGDSDFVEAFFYSEHDPVLVVQSPDGSIQCNDDANELLLDPTITLNAPEAGEYKIWVGSFDEGQLIPGILVLTTRPEVNLGTFDLAGLVDRAPIAKELIKSDDATPTRSPSAALAETSGLTETMATTTTALSLTADQLPFTSTVAVSGTIPAFQYESLEDICNGLLEPLPSLIFELTDEEEALDIFFDSDSDTTLLVETPDGTILCNDDSLHDRVANDEIEEDVNLNPLVTIGNAAAGIYHVYVGRLNDEGAVEGILTITNSGASALPVLTIEEE